MQRFNRCRWEIVLEILEATSKGAKKTHIMYRANLNCVRVNQYLDTLARVGLVDFFNGSNGEVLYRTTERGSELLRALRVARFYIPEIMVVA